MIEYTVSVYENGNTQWSLDGKYHRVGGPAIEYSDGPKYWFLEGKLHREDGPAVEYPDGTKRWFLNGEELTEKEFQQKMNPKPCLGKKVIVDGVEYTLS